MAIKGEGSHGVGRRKSSVARVYVRPGVGKIVVNGRSCEEYFGREILRTIMRQPLVLLGKTEQYDVLVVARGGGKSGQAGAARLGIARAMQTFSEEDRKALRQAGLLTRDSREVERKKFGRHKARKRPQFSKR